MSTEKNKQEEIIDNPFKGFNLLADPNAIKAETKDGQGESKETGDVKETSGSKEDEGAKAREIEAEKKLAEVADKQAKAVEAKKKKEQGLEEEEELKDSVDGKDEEIEEEQESNDLKPFMEVLAEKGIIFYNAEDYKDDDFSNEEVIEKGIAKTIEKSIKDWKDSYPEETKAFLAFVEQGGDPKQFLDIYYNTRSWEDFKTDDETSQKIAVREGLKVMGWDDAEIEDEITLYEDSGKLETKAQQHLTKLKKYEAEGKQELLKQQEEYNKKRNEEAKNYYDNLHKHWYDKEDLNGFKLNKTAKDKVWDFIYKVDKKSGKTGLQESYENNTDAQFMYAYLAMNNFDITKLEKMVESKVTSKVRKSLSNYTDQRFKTTKGSTERESKVTGEEVGFDAFRKIL